MTESSREKKRVLIVGAGFRAANNFIPSFRLLDEDFDVDGVLATSLTRSGPLSERWGIRAYQSLAEIDPGTIDVVAVTVPTKQNRSVLASILAWNPNVLLAIDTPVAWNYREYRELTPLLRKFPAVVVAEDFMNFPQYELARLAVADGLLGRIRSVTLFNTGFAYHGLALLRSFTDLAPVSSSKRTRLGTYSSVIEYRFPKGMRGYIVGPYRQNITGGIVVEGERGVISQAAEDVQFAKVGKRMFYRLASVATNDQGDAFVLEDTNYRLDMPELSKMAAMPFDDHTPLNVWKNVGLTRIFHSLLQRDHLNRPYGFENALYDSFASRLAGLGAFPLDPFVRFGKTFMTLPAFAASRGL